MGEIVEWSCDPAVEFDGQALAILTKMAAALLGTAQIMRATDSFETRQRGIEIVEDLAPHGEMLNEHIEHLEKYAEDILDALMEDEEGYFSNESNLKKFTVTSIIKKKKRTIRIQRFLVTKGNLAVAPDNDMLALECRDGALSCSLKEPGIVPERVRKRALG
ncbi:MULTISPECIES: hypothetical protein [unclassified Methylobacterium]|uniref:hypothetical protein n=1 Tax=unclassified Methylobacterium TaxID=2615210 RepID=UPI002269FB34|nr:MULTISPECIES: hypothetical protein [unclassified Methylobacterium]